MSRICYAPTKIDEKLGALLGVSKNLAAAVRGYYDTKMEELGQPKLDLTDDDAGNLKKLLEAKNTINEFRKQQKQVQHAAINRAVDKMADSFRDLKANFSAEERFNRINMIATDFSFELDKLKAKFKDSSRTELCNGCKTVNGTLVGGEDTIFALVYEKYLQRYNDAMSGAHPNRALAEKWEKVLDNWNALIPYARVVIRQTEAIKLGNSSEFAIEADESNFSDNLLAELFNPEESTREGYQDIDELRSAYASIGKEVRRAIAETYLYLGEKQKNLDLQKINEAARQMKMNGRSDEDIAKFKREAEARAGYAMDDLGYLVRMNPVSTHQQLLEICKGSLTTDRMLKRMKASESEGNSWLMPLISKLEADAELQTKFRNDLHKNFQLYSTISKTIDNGVVKFRSTIKNFKRNNLRDRFYTSITYGKQVQRVPGDLNSIYDETGNFNWESVREFVRFIEREFPGQEEKEESKTNVWRGLEAKESKNVQYKNKSNQVRSALRALGMDVSDAEVQAIMNSAGSRDEVIKNLREIVQYGFKGSEVGNEDIRRYITGKQETFNPSRQKYMDAVGQRTGSDATKLREKLDKILEVIASKNEAYKLESRVPYKDKKGKTNSLSSFINPCYLGDFIEKINEFAKEKDVDGLKKFLENKFMCSSYYGEWVDGKFHFYNKWLEELYNCDKKNIDKAFASLLSYKRFLGTASQNFEDFTSKQHTLDLLTEFSFAENKRLGNRPMAWYPVFITGDSGVQRYLQAPVYKKEEILEGLFNVWKQEVQKWQLTRGVNQKLTDLGFDDKHLISNLSHKDGIYSFLPFLNKDFKGFDGQVGKYAGIVEKYQSTDLEAGVKEAIRQYMEDAEANFEKQLTNLGIIKGRVAENVDPKIKDKLVTQRFEYTMSFFNETNKRHPKTKEEQAQNTNKTREQKFEETEKQFLEDFFYNTKFATIQQLQLMTVDPAYYGKEKKKDGVWTFSDETKDLQKRYKEIHAPGTTLDIYARDKYRGGTYSGLDENGNPLPERCIYFDEIKIDAWNTNPEFMQVLENKYGKITEDSKFGKYLENAYTDGQGYRSLESYRKVMGMAGKWNEEMERAYKAIQDLRTKIRNADRDATKEELEQMSEIMTVVFQPIKPYMYTFEQFRVNNGPGGIMNIPVQHKYAEAVLIPELLPAGSQLRYLAEYMDNPDNNIDLVCSTTVVKVGSFGSTDISQATTREAMNEALSRGYVHQLSYSDYRIQTNVPDHFNNQSQLFGTQIRKLIMAGINLDPNSSEYHHYRDYVDFGEEHSKLVNLGEGMVELNGHNLIKFYNELITSNIVKCYDVFAGAVKDIKGLSNLLTQSIINNERESLDNILAFSLTNDFNFLVPLFEGATEHDSAALILSKFKKRVNKQTIQGGSAVQVSAWGINRVDKTSKRAKELRYVCSEDRKNILYAQCEVPFDLTVYDSNNQPIKLEFTDYCNPDGTLIANPELSKLERRLSIAEMNEGWAEKLNDVSGRLEKQFGKPSTEISLTQKEVLDFVGKILGNDYLDTYKWEEVKTLSDFEEAVESLKRGYDSEELLKEIKALPKSKLEAEYPGILDMVAYRIPTEKAYSMLNLKIVRFSHKIAGGTLRVPAQGTTQAGFDFDIDKLYFMRKCFKRKSMELSQDDVDKVWKYAYGKNKDFREALQRERDRYNKEQEEKRKSGTPTSDELIDDLLKTMFSAEDVESVANSEKKNRLYSFWQEASLPGTPQEFFNKYRDEALGIREPFETYDPTKTPWENSKVARDNMLIDLMRARLMDPETLDARVTPQSFDTHSQAARFMRELQFGDLGSITRRGRFKSIPSINIYAGTNENADLSNFAIRPFKLTWEELGIGPGYDEVEEFQSVEQAFQWLKANHPLYNDSSAPEDVSANTTVSQEIKNTTNGARLRQLGKAIRGLDSKSWDAHSSEEMKKLIKASFQQNPQALQRLLSTGNATLTHSQDRGKWGTEFPRILMEVRNELAAEQGMTLQSTEVTTEGVSVDLSAIEERMKDKSLDPEPNYDPSDPMTIVTYNQQNQVASKLIGIFANQNANYALSTLMHTLSLNLDKCKIGFCGHQYSDLLHKDDKEFARMVEDNVAGYLAASVDAVKDPVLNFLNLNTLNADAGAALARLGYTPREIGLLFNQPSVKAICDNCFNNNTGQISEEIDTYMKACIDLLHNKYGEDYVKDASTDGFLTQQVLSDMIVQDRVAKENNEDLLKTGSRDFIYNQIKVMEQFKNAMALSKALTDFVRVTRFTAANSIGSTLGNIYAQQLAVEDYVRQLAQTEVKDAILDIQLTDIEGLKAPITMTDNSFLTGAEYMKKIYNNPFAYEQCMFDMNRRVIRDLCTKEVNEETGKERRAYYPYETVPYKSARMLISQLCNYGTLDEETVNQIHSDLLVFLMNKRLGGSIFDGNAEYRELGEVYEYKDKDGKMKMRYPTMAEYYREIFPQQIFGIRDHLSNVGIPLFEAMSYKTVQLVNGKEVVVLSIEDSSNMQSFQSDAVRDSWEDLFNGKYDEFVVGSVEEQTKMAVDLFLYNFYKSGFSYTPFSFIHLAPAELKASLQIGSEIDPNTGEMRKVLYKDFLNELLDSKVFGNADTWSVTMQEFAKLFIKNHIDNSRLAYTIRTGTNLYRTFSSNIKVFTQSGAVLPSFTVDLNSFKGVTQFLTIPSQCTEELTAFKPCLVIDNQVYIANGNSGMFNISTDDTMEYVWVADIGELNPDDVRNRTLNYTPGVAEDYASRKAEDGSNQPPSAPTNPFGTGNTSVEPEPVTLDEDKIDRDLDFARGELINQMIKEITLARIAAGDTEASVKAVREEFMSMDSGSFEAQLEAYKNAQRDSSNLLVLDKDGKVKPAC